MSDGASTNAPMPRTRRTELLRVALLIAVIAVIWCLVNNRTSPWKWNVPLGYGGGDSMLVMAWAKDASEGHYWPVLPKSNPSLGAPFTANWNDYPVTEDTLIFFMGCLVKLTGLFVGCNLAVLIGVILAGVTFYLVCRWLRVAWEWAFAGGIIYSFSTYASARSLWHITLGYYWHIPLCILVCWWMISCRGLDFKGRRFWFALAVGFVTGIQNPYYTNLFLQFTGFAFLAQLIRLRCATEGQVRSSLRRKLVAPVAVGAAAFLGFLLMNLDTFYYHALHGKNPDAVTRNYSALEAYALRPIDLMVPPLNHMIPLFRKISMKYGSETMFPGEGFGSAYIGVIGMVALFWLIWITIKKVLGKPARPVPGRMLQIIWIAVYAEVGGWNCILGLLGLQLFRGTDRFSIWILALLLMFLMKRLGIIFRERSPAVRAGFATLLCAVAIVDQVPRIPHKAALEATKAIIDSDRGIADRLMQALPAQSMIFQLPVADFPEMPHIVQMADYEHLRPYLFSHQLRYSYGSDKGREIDIWEHETGDLKPAEMIARLEACGFGAIWINRNGYADHGKALIDGLRDAGRGETIESARGDLVCVLIHPSPQPMPPNPLMEFTSGWHVPENDSVGAMKERWSGGNAKIELVNTSTAPLQFNISFDVSSLVPRKLTVMNGTTTIMETEIGPESKRIPDTIFELKLGETQILFKIDIPAAQKPGSPDPRKFGFFLENISIKPVRQ